MQLLQWQTNGTKILRRCSVCCGRHFDGCGELFLEERKIADDLCFLNCTSICSQPSTSSTMSKNWMPTSVYQRRTDRKNSVPFFEVASSAISSEAPPLAAEDHAISVPENATEGVSTSSTKSKNWMPTFVYQRRRDHKNSVPFAEVVSSAISSEAPPLAAEEHAISVPENATEGVSTSSKNWMPTFVYQRGRDHKNSVPFFEVATSAISSEAPPLAAEEHAISLPEKATAAATAAVSTSSTMSKNWMPTFVYQSRRDRKNSVPFVEVASSAISSEAPPLAAEEHAISVPENATAGVSTSSTMSKNWMPTFVYQRRRDRKNSVPFFEVESSAVSSEAPLLAAEENAISVPEKATEGVRSPLGHLVESNKVTATVTTDVDGVLNDCSANDHCSSSKSNLELSSAMLKVHTDDAGECSSSAALIAQKAPAEKSERDVCISILRSYGLLDRVGIRRDRASNGNTGLSSNNYCSKSCKVCKLTESSKSMIICDNCDDAFHTYCYIPRITILPVSEWLCSSCLKKKHKILKDKFTSSNLVNTSSGSGKDRNSSSEMELGSLEFMLRDTEPYMSNALIGDDFQADVPDWNGPINEECNLNGDPLEVGTSSNGIMQDMETLKFLKHNSIGNWLQCREVIEGVGEGIDGTVCGKWRRAPLFEVQTDNWECFRCVLWDPTHADCAVPQELDTDEVMKQLKYVEMLRPRLAAKRHKPNSLKGSSSSQNPSRL